MFVRCGAWGRTVCVRELSCSVSRGTGLLSSGVFCDAVRAVCASETSCNIPEDSHLVTPRQVMSWFRLAVFVCARGTNCTPTFVNTYVCTVWSRDPTLGPHNVSKALILLCRGYVHGRNSKLFSGFLYICVCVVHWEMETLKCIQLERAERGEVLGHFPDAVVR